jgi:hypothetical protein
MLEKQDPENNSNFLCTGFAPEYNQPKPKYPKSLHENLASTSSRKVGTDMGYITYNKLLLWRLFF